MNDNVFIFRKRNRGLLSTGSYNGRDTIEEMFLLFGAGVKSTFLPMLAGLFTVGYSSLFLLAGVLSIGVVAGVIKYKYFPYQIISYFNTEVLPWSYGDLATKNKDETDFKDAA